MFFFESEASVQRADVGTFKGYNELPYRGQNKIFSSVLKKYFSVLVFLNLLNLISEIDISCLQFC